MGFFFIPQLIHFLILSSFILVSVYSSANHLRFSSFNLSIVGDNRYHRGNKCSVDDGNYSYNPTGQRLDFVLHPSWTHAIQLIGLCTQIPPAGNAINCDVGNGCAMVVIILGYSSFYRVTTTLVIDHGICSS
ncbi:hypothetical protein ACTA71_007306 [Dictyostelium dimigraforme]